MQTIVIKNTRLQIENVTCSLSFFSKWAFLVDQTKPACNGGGMGSIPGLGRCPGEGTGSPLQYSCLENSMNRGDWWATVHGVARSWT